MKLTDLPDHTLAELITESRERLASVVTPGECIGRRVARQNLRLLESERDRRICEALYAMPERAS